MQTWHLHISGQVQGVGFRPYVYRMAVGEGLKGCVKNTNDGVHLFFNAEASQARRFSQELLAQVPTIAQLTDHSLVSAPFQSFSDFQIVHSQDSGLAKLLLSPDFGLCADCRADLFAPDNRRRNYAFTTCTYCGPRFSITEALPYDRPVTTMRDFQLCATCQEEYHNPTDRRYYSQTNSCPNCGVELRLYAQGGQLIGGEQEELLDRVLAFWKAGKIVALKGIGGYLLTCDAGNAAAIQQLRQRKHRPTKPLAVLFPDLVSMSRYVSVEEDGLAATTLAGPVAPITVLPLRASASADLALNELAPGLNKLGVMLPYTPLYALLLARYGAPVVATSGNRSGQPIIHDDLSALRELRPLADYVLTNNRAIVVPQDDSVLQWSTHYGQRIVLRRARGMAPTFRSRHSWYTDGVLAMGADMKSAFALLHQQQLYLSPYLGDLTDLATQDNHSKVLDHLLRVLKAKPTRILTDEHPQYASTHLGVELAARQDLPHLTVPHHEAHFAAILGEHGLAETESPILGVIWDGTGLGTDGQIWGGELFDYRDGRIARIAQLEYFASPLGDKLAREPRLCAWSLLASAGLAPDPLLTAFSAEEYTFYQQLFALPARLSTSSIGRLFDGVAALLGLKLRQSHEAEAAMLLEACAQEYAQRQGLGTLAESYLDWTDSGVVDFSTRELLPPLLADLAQGCELGLIALRFHQTLVAWIAAVAQSEGYQKIACSGGVFQNSLLVDLCVHHLGADFDLYFHEQLASNDENIAFGQLVWYDIQQLAKSKNKEYVLSHTR